jgi:hypothetical protein
MTDLFVSYWYWNERERCYRFGNTVIAAENVLNDRVHSLNDVDVLTKMTAKLLGTDDFCILYWRRMEA